MQWMTRCAYDAEQKRSFHSTARRRLRGLADILGWAPTTYDLRSNQGGIAVSGEITLHHEHLYIQVSQPTTGHDTGILIRSCEGRRDYHGGRNHLASLRLLDDLPALAARVRVVAGTLRRQHRTQRRGGLCQGERRSFERDGHLTPQRSSKMTNAPLPPMSPAAKKFFTQEQYAQLIDNGRRQVHVKGTKAELDPFPVVKLFFAAGAGTWLLTELEPDEPDIAWGLCDLGMGFPEFGTVSLLELAEIKRFGLGVERDRHFTAKAPISRYIDAAFAAEHIVEELTP